VLATIRTRWIVPMAWTAAIASMPAQGPQKYSIDPGATSVMIHVGKAGMFAFAGHDHEVAAPAVQGTITMDPADPTRSTLTLTFDAAAMKVTGKGEPAADVPEVQRVMLSERVLDVQRYPTLTFRSRSVSLVQKSADRLALRITGDLTLRGTRRPLVVPVQVRLTANGLSAEGKVTLRQTDFGIQPVTAAGGTVRVKDELEIVFSVNARTSQ
jgi:polyisoprenoid-binding protein YceI